MAGCRTRSSPEGAHLAEVHECRAGRLATGWLRRTRWLGGDAGGAAAAGTGASEASGRWPGLVLGGGFGPGPGCLVASAPSAAALVVGQLGFGFGAAVGRCGSSYEAGMLAVAFPRGTRAPVGVLAVVICVEAVIVPAVPGGAGASPGRDQLAARLLRLDPAARVGGN